MRRPPNDSSEIGELLSGGSGSNRARSLEPRGRFRGELLPVDIERGSIGWALSGATQQLRSKHHWSSTTESMAEPSTVPLRWATLDVRGDLQKHRTRSRSVDGERVAPETPQGKRPSVDLNNSEEKISRLQREVDNLRMLNGVLRSELPDSKVETAVNAWTRKVGSRRDGVNSRSASPLRSSAARSKPCQEREPLLSDPCGMHNARCASSSPCSDGKIAAGRPLYRTATKLCQHRCPTPEKRRVDRSPVNPEMPKGRKVLIDKNAPSDHWMANPSSNLKENMIFEWQRGIPELEWKGHVPSAIPVKAMKDKRPADPQGRPWVRQYAIMQKNSSSDPWAFQACRPDEPPPFDERGEEGKGRRLFPEQSENKESFSICSRFETSSATPRPATSSSTSRPAGRDTRSTSCDRRRQFEERHKNQPTDPEFSPMGVRPPAAEQWQARASRSVSCESARSSRHLSPGRGRYRDMPGDSGLSPLTGKRRGHFPWRP